MPVEHVFVLMLENRSLDHMLGCSAITGTDAESGQSTQLRGLTGQESNQYDGTDYPATCGADWTMPVDPGHGFLDVLEQLCGPHAVYARDGEYPPIDDSGFAANYAKNHGRDPAEIMKCFKPDQLPVLTALATEFAVCDGWCASMPGPTWPNRFFAHGASSSGLDDSPTMKEVLEWMTFDGFEYQNGSIFKRLSSAGRSWRVYAGDFTPQVASLKGIDVFDVWHYARFASDVASTDYAIDYTWIEPSYGHVWSDYTCGTSQHPLDDVTRGERLLKCTYEALRASPLWDTSLLIVTWDEHGGFYDGGGPGRAPRPDDTPPHDYSQHGFTFDVYGVRVPAVVASPLVPQNIIDHRTYDHSSIPKTVEHVFGLESLTARDAAALSAAELATLDSPRDTPETLPEPAVSGDKRCAPVPPCGPGTPMLEALASEAPTEPLPPAASPDEPVDTEPNLPGLVYVAHRRDMAISPPEEQPARQARVREIVTRAHARDYLEEVRQRYLAAGAAGLLPG